MFVFKMLEVGPDLRVDLMHVGGDLQDVWVMFDHIKHLKRYTTFTCHVHDSHYCKTMTIVICDMMSKIHDAQAYLWHGLNNAIPKHGVHNVNSKGFMANNAQTNWNIVVRFMILVANRRQCKENNVFVYCIKPNACKRLPID